MTHVRPRAGTSALILDLDGVLADTEPLHQKAWDIALDGIPLEKVAAARSKWVGMASVDIVRELIRIFGLTMPAEELLARKRAAYQTLIQQNLAPFPGLREELDMWRGFPMALATSGIRPEATSVLCGRRRLSARDPCRGGCEHARSRRVSGRRHHGHATHRGRAVLGLPLPRHGPGGQPGGKLAVPMVMRAPGTPC